MSRFSDIKRGTELKAKQDAYLTYLSTVRTPNLNSRGAREPQDLCGVYPFDLDMAASDFAAVRGNQDGVNGLKATVNNVTGAQVLHDGTYNAANAKTVTGFSPARVVYTHAQTRSVSTPPSRFTGRPYLKYNNLTRWACPFGRESSAGTSKMSTIFPEVKAGILTIHANYEVRRVSLTPEKLSLR